MDYQRIYNQLIERARSENRVKGGGSYYEAHHIVPKCMGGEGKGSEWKTHPNIILLTAREHFLAHYYLTRVYPESNKLAYAFWSMCNQASDSQDRDYSEIVNFAELYQEAKETFSKINSEAKKGRPSPSKGRPQSEEAKAKKSAALKGRPKSKESIAKKSAALKGRPKSEEHRAKMSAARKGRPSPLKGRPKSEEAIAKRSATRKLRREGIFLNKS